MVLQEEFQKNGYIDLLFSGNATSEFGIDLEDIFDSDNQPKELLGIFISEQRDDLFFLLDGGLEENGKRDSIGSLCDRWDDRIRVFTIMNGKSKTVRKLKYNIVQLIIYSGKTPDKSREGNLLMSRKIIIKGDLTDKRHIIIDDDDAIELPFHMISADAFAPDVMQMQKLNQLLPTDDDLLAIMKEKKERVNRKSSAKAQPKHYSEQDFAKIKRWLER